MTTSTPIKQNSASQLLESQKLRVAALQERRTRAVVRLETDRATLQIAENEAMAQFGTSDLAALRALFLAQTAANDSAVQEYIASVNEVERQLSEVERQLKL